MNTSAQQQKKKKGQRDYQTYLLIGGKGQGKSTLLRRLMDEYTTTFTNVYKDQPFEPRVFIHDMSGSRAFADIPTVEQAIEGIEKMYGKKLNLVHPLDLLKLKDEQGNPVWRKGALRYVCRRQKDIQYMYGVLSDHLRNALLILDEWTTYVRANPPDWQIEMVNNHRNYGLEVILVCHQLLKVPPFFVRGDMVAKITIFKTGEENITEKQIQSKYACASRLWAAYQRVSKAPETDDFIQYHETIEV